jgi:hypothetical protein
MNARVYPHDFDGTLRYLRRGAVRVAHGHVVLPARDLFHCRRQYATLDRPADPGFDKAEFGQLDMLAIDDVDFVRAVCFPAHTFVLELWEADFAGFAVEVFVCFVKVA